MASARVSPGIEFSWTRFWAKVLAEGVFDGRKEVLAEDRGRWSSRKKMDAVLRLLKGEDLDLLSRELRAATLSSWRNVFLANGLAGLKSRDIDARDEKIGALHKALGETALNLEISREINRVYERKHGPSATGKSTK
jgi:transposase